MGFNVSREVWEHAPEDLSMPVMMVLLAIADSASQETRMTALSVDSIAEKARMSRSTTLRALKTLRQRGLIQKVAKGHEPDDLTHYRSEIRRVTEVEHWSHGVPVPDYVNPEKLASEGCQSDTPDEFGGVTETPNPNYSPSGSIKSTSYSYGTTPSASFRNRTRPKKSWGRYQDPDEVPEDIDPRNSQQLALFHGEDLPAPGTAADDEDLLSPKKHVRPEPGPDTGLGLATYFADKMRQVDDWHPVEFPNRVKMAGALNRWKRDHGIRPDFIRQMIDLYVADPGIRTKTGEYWTDFIAKRSVLARKLKRLSFQDEISRFDPDIYNSQQPAQQDPNAWDPDAYLAEIQQEMATRHGPITWKYEYDYSQEQF